MTDIEKIATVWLTLFTTVFVTTAGLHALFL